MAEILRPENFNTAPQRQAQMQYYADVQRIAIGMDMLVGLLAEKWQMSLQEEKDADGNVVLRWRPINPETTQSEGKEPTDSEA